MTIVFDIPWQIAHWPLPEVDGRMRRWRCEVCWLGLRKLWCRECIPNGLPSFRPIERICQTYGEVGEISRRNNEGG